MSSYLQKYAYTGKAIHDVPHRDLGLVVAVVGTGTVDLIATLQSLYACGKPPCAVEVVALLYAPAGADDAVRAAHVSLWRESRQWAEHYSSDDIRFHVLLHDRLPQKHVGLGLARKIAMDEALRRLDAVGRVQRGLIASLDAGTQVRPNYLKATWQHFDKRPNSHGCTVYFQYQTLGSEHPQEVYRHLAYEELYRRYCHLALRSTGFPYPFHSHGGAMVVRCDVYQREGGMNRRGDDADFHFLQKLVALERFTELRSTAVYCPPVGPHLAKADVATRTRYVYNLQAYKYLRIFFKNVPEFYLSGARLVTLGGILPYVMIDFLNGYFFDERIEEIRNNSSGFSSFERRFFRWFNAEMVERFLLFVRDNAHRNARLEPSALELLRLTGLPDAHCIRSFDALLDAYRAVDAGRARVEQLLPD